MGRLNGAEEVLLRYSQSHSSGLADEHSVDDWVFQGAFTLSNPGPLTTTTLVESTISTKSCSDSILSSSWPLALYTEDSHWFAGDHIVSKKWV